jgi:hypothetical protein
LETKGKYGRRKSNKNGKLENSVGRNNGGGGAVYQGYNNVCPKAHSWPLAQTLILVLTKIMNFVILSARQDFYSGKETRKEKRNKIKNKELR